MNKLSPQNPQKANPKNVTFAEGPRTVSNQLRKAAICGFAVLIYGTCLRTAHL